ncbi:hypothetical protein ABTX34_35745 [Streptomyces sp. NPDC096538]|uniref:hypothetical protein n=1 Tax=Streptomyces sp. NPDC096538 TaxID=3155427 RepID=UPI003328E488
MHTHVARELGGMAHEDTDLARIGNSTDLRRAAAARFAQQVVTTRGQVTDTDLTAVRNTGYTDAQILAIVTVAVQYLLTNVNQTTIDIPTTTPA